MEEQFVSWKIVFVLAHLQPRHLHPHVSQEAQMFPGTGLFKTSADIPL